MWEVSIEGKNPHPVLPDWNHPSSECCGDWTPDGRYYVFQSTRNGRTDIWALRDERSFLRKPDREPVQLTTGPLNYWAPLPSRDGKRLYVVGEQPRGELVRYDAKLRQNVPYLSGVSAEQVRFSKDGAWAAYVAYPESTLWRTKLDGSERLQLTFPWLAACRAGRRMGNRSPLRALNPGSLGRSILFLRTGGRRNP